MVPSRYVLITYFTRSHGMVRMISYVNGFVCLFVCLSFCPYCKRKIARTVNTKVGTW